VGDKIQKHAMAVSGKCPECGRRQLQREYNFMSGIYGGHVVCKKCDFLETCYSYMSRLISKKERQ
jgi:predicted RNA-binding Zn-ribbon protein involved in translation (DUF1610 family)